MHIKQAVQVVLTSVCFALVGYGIGYGRHTEPAVEVRYIHNDIINEVIVLESQQCIDNLDCMLLAEAIYYEARGEPLQGQIAVAHVILNRVHSSYHPNSISSVIGKHCQFSYRCDGSTRKGITNVATFQTALKVASKVLAGEYTDPTNGADHYFNPSKMNVDPDWSNEYSRVAKIGQHVFHKRG